MAKYWLISDRDNNGIGTGRNADGLTFWVSDGVVQLNNIASWTNVSADQFQKLLVAAADSFPALPPRVRTKIKVTSRSLFTDSTRASITPRLYQDFCGRLF